MADAATEYLEDHRALRQAEHGEGDVERAQSQRMCEQRIGGEVAAPHHQRVKGEGTAEEHTALHQRGRIPSKVGAPELDACIKDAADQPDGTAYPERAGYTQGHRRQRCS